MEDYELKPSRQNPDLKKRMEEQTQASANGRTDATFLTVSD